MKILANDGISSIGKSQLEAAGYVVITEHVPQEQLIDYINANQIDMLLVRSATTARKDLIDSCPSIKLIGRGGVGMDNIDVDYARSKGLVGDQYSRFLFSISGRACDGTVICHLPLTT
jgi:D-3-phosphoglycerate dehydrogenase / 2-oxoglutarate reductase